MLHSEVLSRCSNKKAKGVFFFEFALLSARKKKEKKKNKEKEKKIVPCTTPENKFFCCNSLFLELQII